MEEFKKHLNYWKESSHESIRLIAFGSSNTELSWHSDGCFNWFSWVSATIHEKFGHHIACINQGIGGEMVTDLLARIERDVISFNPKAVIITIGGNDANRGLPINTYMEKLELVVEKVIHHNGVPILQTYYCPIYKKMGKNMQKFPDYVEWNRKLSKKFNLTLIDNYKCFEPLYRNDYVLYKNLMRDPIHLSPIGNAVMGIIASRSLGLPDPKLPTAFKTAKKYIKVMEKYSDLPKKQV